MLILEDKENIKLECFSDGVFSTSSTLSGTSIRDLINALLALIGTSPEIK